MLHYISLAKLAQEVLIMRDDNELEVALLPTFPDNAEDHQVNLLPAGAHTSLTLPDSPRGHRCFRYREHL